MPEGGNAEVDGSETKSIDHIQHHQVLSYIKIEDDAYDSNQINSGSSLPEIGSNKKNLNI